MSDYEDLDEEEKDDEDENIDEEDDNIIDLNKIEELDGKKFKSEEEAFENKAVIEVKPNDDEDDDEDDENY